MPLWGDDRGQSVVIGAVILFGFLVIAMSTYQATVVPQQNSQVEFSHEQTVRNDFVGVRDAVVTTGTTGETAPAAVKLGTRFPGRTLFVNPPPAVGRIETGEPRNVTLNVSQAAFSTDVPGERAETEEGWPTAAATDGNYTSRPLVYTPQYRSYDGGPENITLELSHAVATYPDGERLNLTQTPLLASGDRVTLFLLKGNLSETGVESVTLEPSAVSAVSDRQRVSNFNVTVPTSLTANQFETVLTRGNTLDRGDVIVTENTSRRAVDVRFPDEYALGVAAVSVGRHQEQRRASAVDFVSVEENVTQGESARVVVGVRDQYGNALPGATVTANASAFDGAVQQTDGTGRTAFEFNTSGESGTVAVNVTVNESVVTTTGTGPFDQSTAENATANVTVEKPSDGGGGGGNGTSGSWPFWWVSPDAIGQNSTLTLTDCDNESCTVDAGDTDANLNLRVTTVGETSGANVTYAINDTSVASLNESTSTTNAAGNDTVALRPEANGSFGVRVSATSGGTTTTIRVRYQNVNYTPGTAPPSPAVKITAVQPEPESGKDGGEFVRVEIPDGTNTSGWSLKDEGGDLKELPSDSRGDLSGTVYFAQDTNKLDTQWDVSEKLRSFDGARGLNNGGDVVKIVNADGDEIDRFVYGGGSETFSDGNSFTFSDANAVANRTNLAADGTYDDTDSPSDWSEEDACQFFDGGDGCPAALNTKKVSGSAGGTGSSGQAEFDLTNSGDTDVEIVAIAWNATSSSATVVTGGGKKFDAVGGGGGGGGGEYDGDIQLGGGRYDLDTTDTLSSGETQTYKFDRFEDSDGSKVDMTGESVTITLYFDDDSQKTITLNFS